MSKHIWYEHIVCMDGFTLSVQAGEGSYCEPKESPYDEKSRWKKDFGYKTVEIQMQGGTESLFDDYISKGCHNCGSDAQGYDEYKDPLGFVPVELLAKVIEKHGGVIQGSIPPFHKKWQVEFKEKLKNKTKGNE